jgi:hypothetical protein
MTNPQSVTAGVASSLIFNSSHNGMVQENCSSVLQMQQGPVLGPASKLLLLTWMVLS